MKKMKAILVIDLPDEINSEEYKGFLTVDRFYATDEEVGTKIDAEPMRFRWLKIKPLPQKMSWGHSSDFIDGYNACIDEIAGETE